MNEIPPALHSLAAGGVIFELCDRGISASKDCRHRTDLKKGIVLSHLLSMRVAG